MLREGASKIKRNSGLLCGARMVDKVITSQLYRYGQVRWD